MHRAGATLGNKLLSPSFSPFFPLQETAPATPVFANQLTVCSVIAHQKTWVQMWWGAGARTQNEILVFQIEPRFNYSLNERLLKPSLLCCFSSPIVSQPCALLNHQLPLSCLDAFIKGDDAKNCKHGLDPTGTFPLSPLFLSPQIFPLLLTKRGFRESPPISSVWI